MTDRKMKVVMTLEFDLTYDEFVKKFNNMDKVAVDSIWKSLKSHENDKGEVEIFDDGNDEELNEKMEEYFFNTAKEQIEDEMEEKCSKCDQLKEIAVDDKNFCGPCYSKRTPEDMSEWEIERMLLQVERINMMREKREKPE